MTTRKPLYSEEISRHARDRETGAAWTDSPKERVELVMSKLGECHSFLDLGCGWGAMLRAAAERVSRVVGVDESPHRVKDLQEQLPQADVRIRPACDTGLDDASFDVVLASQVLHEVKQFGEPGELEATLQEVWRVLTPGGRFMILDHLDAGEGSVVVRLSPDAMGFLKWFVERFRYRPVTYNVVAPHLIRISRRNLQDFATKTWSYKSPLEEMEMRETHCPFSRADLEQLIEGEGLHSTEWIAFHQITRDLEPQGMELVEGESWPRKFLMIATKGGSCGCCER